MDFNISEYVSMTIICGYTKQLPNCTERDIQWAEDKKKLIVYGKTQAAVQGIIIWIVK